MTHYVFYLPPCPCLCARSEQFICRVIKLKFRAISDASPAHFSENNFTSLRCIYIENIQMSYNITGPPSANPCSITIWSASTK